jgi:hypothetical protein
MPHGEAGEGNLKLPYLIPDTGFFLQAFCDRVSGYS